MVVTLDIRDVPQGNRHRVADLVGNADAVEAGGKLAGVRGRNKEDSHRQRHKIFQRNVEHIKQLLSGQIIPPEQMAQHRAGAIERRALVGVKQKDEQIVQRQEHQHKDQHEPDFPQLDVAEFERRKADDHQPQQHPSIVGDHAGEGEQQKERQLGCSSQLMHHAFTRQVVQNGISSHAHAPPCQPR